MGHHTMAAGVAVGICLLISLQVLVDVRAAFSHRHDHDHNHDHVHDHDRNHDHGHKVEKHDGLLNGPVDATMDVVDLGLSLLTESLIGVKHPHNLRCPGDCMTSTSSSDCLKYQGIWCNELEFCEISKHVWHYKGTCRNTNVINYCTNKRLHSNTCLTSSPCTVGCCTNQSCVDSIVPNGSPQPASST